MVVEILSFLFFFHMGCVDGGLQGRSFEAWEKFLSGKVLKDGRD